MEQFPDGHHVWLRSRHRLGGAYLHADDDGQGVSLRRGRASLSAAWAVHLDNGHLLLHSAAYGRYLAATTTPAPGGHRGFRVALRNFDQPDLEAIRWEALNMGSTVRDVLLRDVNRRYLPWNNGATVDDFDNSSTMMQWTVVPIAARQRVPDLPRPIRASLLENLSLFLFRPTATDLRVIRVYTAEEWFALPFWNRSVYELREEVATRYVHYYDFVICVRPGLYGRLTPLVVDLPRNIPGDRHPIIEIIIMLHGTPEYNNLRHPDVDA